MKKLFFLLLVAVLVISCSKKVDVKGKIANASPLERVEIVEASGVGTLPLVNMGLSKTGEFSGNFEAPKNGLYAITYAGNMNVVYLKKGQALNISGNAANFPQKMVITGDAKANNDFIQQAQRDFEQYASKINVQQMVMQKEPKFLTDFKKIHSDLQKQIEDSGKKLKADQEAVDFKLMETNARLLGLMDAYEQYNGQMSGNTSFKASKAFQDLKQELAKDQDKMIAEIPAYRDYMLNRMNQDFQKFAQSQSVGPDTLISDVFAKFLKTKKDLSQVTKDYLYAYVIAQSDINFNNYKKYDQVSKLIDDNITDSKVKTDLKHLQTVLMGFKNGTAPELKLVSKSGKSAGLADLKGKPTLVTFYASWNPNIAITTVPVLKEVAQYFKSKLNFAYVNLDDTKEQFEKTSAAMFGAFPGTNYWAEGGINADQVREFGLYGFKIPSYMILDKDGKILGRPYFNLGDPELVRELEKITGIKAPQVAPQQQMVPQMQPQTAPPAQGQVPATADSAHAEH